MKLVRNERQLLGAEFTAQEFADFMSLLKGSIIDYEALSNSNSFEVEIHRVSKEKIEEIYNRLSSIPVKDDKTYIEFPGLEWLDVLNVVSAASELYPSVSGISYEKANEISDMMYDLSKARVKEFSNG